jgi:hypothetical protein
MLSRDVKGALLNDTNVVRRHPYPIRVLGRARRPRKYGPKRGGTKQAKRVRVATNPTEDATKTKTLAEIDGRESNRNDNDTKSLKGNDDTSYAEAPSDSTYCEGDE